MATVYLGRMAGPKGFSRTIAIKQLHAQLVSNADFVTMFVDEAHLIGRIHHANVVAPIDVVEADGELCIVMEYVHGEAVGQLMRLSRHEHIPLRVVSAIMVQTLLGLHAAHEVSDAEGNPLSIVHRDVSPQNILVGEDGISRVVDFGIAKVAYRAGSDDMGKLKGKLGYMAPEQLAGGELDRRCDIFSAGIILWEMLTGKRLFAGATSPAEATERMQHFEPRPPSSIVPSLCAELDAIALKALSVAPDGRFANAHDMARAIEAALPPAGAIEVAEWVKRLVGDSLSTRAQWISELAALDLSEWTQSYGMSTIQSSAPPPLVPMEPAAQNEVAMASPQSTARGLPGAPIWRKVRRRLSKRRLGALAALLLLTAGCVAGVVFWTHATVPPNRHTTVVFAASPSVSPADGAAAPQLQQQSLPVTAPTPFLPSTASAPRAPATTVPAPSRGPRADCRVPYVIDSKGIKRFRPECFR
jgi:serine/threonine-protein kinase